MTFFPLGAVALTIAYGAGRLFFHGGSPERRLLRFAVFAIAMMAVEPFGWWLY